MSRFENLCIQCLMGLLLMLVIGGCSPGSAGSGTGPSSSEPPPIAGTPPGATPNSTPSLPIVPGANLVTGVTFNNSDLLGRWIDVASSTTLDISNESIVLKRACREFVFQGSWVATQALAIQLSGTLTSQASSSLGITAGVDPSGLVLALPTSNQLYAEVIRNVGDSVLRLPGMVRATNNETLSISCPS
jgi:hypothetical protein